MSSDRSVPSPAGVTTSLPRWLMTLLVLALVATATVATGQTPPATADTAPATATSSADMDRVSLPAAAPDATRVIVRGDSSAAAASTAVSVGGQVVTQLPLADAAIVDVDGADGRVALESAGLQVFDDVPMTFSSTPNWVSDEGSTTSDETVDADKLRAAGVDGTGVGVALVDTGVDLEHPDVADRLVAVANLSDEPSGDDSYGHGTFMAGLVAGDGDSSQGQITGAAPDAHLVSVKVAGSDGATSLSRVLYGLQLVDASAEQFDVDVVVLALAAPPTPDELDPLEATVQQMWANGLTVVVAAGNNPEFVSSPATNPYVLTAGATNDHGTDDLADDTEAVFSPFGEGDQQVVRPDVAAPGDSVVSLRAVGSTIDKNHADAREGGRYFRGSGTSMSAATTAGAAALLLDANPDWTPDEVKGALQSAAVAVDGRVGQVDADDAAAADAVANQQLDRLEEDQAPYPEDGEWTSHSWASHSWTGHSWTGHSWTSHSWASHSWAGHSWTSHSWTSHSWTGHSWASHSWASHSWASHSWAWNAWD